MSKPYILSNYDNRFLDAGATVTASSTAAAVSAANMFDGRLYTIWKPANTSQQTITLTLTASASADSLAIAGHDFATQGTAISLESSTDNFAADTTQIIAPFTLTNNRPIFCTFTQLSKRYWRLKIAAGSTAAPFIAVLCLGNKIEMPEYITNEGFDPMQHQVVSQSHVSQTGQMLGSAIAYKKLRLNPKFHYISNDFVNNIWIPFVNNHAGKLLPFFWVWDYSKAAEETHYVTFTDNPDIVMPYTSGAAYRNISLELTGVY